MAVGFRFAVQTDLGTVRTNNEDSALGSSRLLVLADGMGGHAAGEVASTVAMRVFAGLDHTTGVDLGVQIVHAGRSARRALVEMSEADPMLESMGTTLVTVASDGKRVTVGHIGDSRVYALRGDSLFQVTTDHTHVQRLIDQGQLTPERARTHPYRAMLLRSLDDQAGGPDLDVIDLDIAAGDRLLLCSDGLSDYLSPEHIGELLGIADRNDSANALIDAALTIGTRDNVTVVVADVIEESDGGASAPADRPIFAGAVADGITLSPDAKSALGQALPTLDIDPAEPTRGAHIVGSAPANGQAASTTEGEPKASGRAAVVGSENRTPAPVEAAREGRPSQLPGVLAAVAALVIVATIWLILR